MKTPTPKTEPRTLADLIRLHECDDPSDTAAAVLASIKTIGEARTLLFTAVRDVCRRESRGVVRGIESSSLTGHRTDDTHESIAGEGTTRDDFLKAHFCTGTGYVTWGEATTDDHRARIAMQAALRNGIEADIDKHTDAIERIEAAGVACLNEITEQAA